MAFSFLRRLAVTALICTASILPAVARAQQPDSDRGDASAQREFARISLAGSYLAARAAGADRDVEAASTYWRQAMRRDPSNPEIAERAFFAMLIEGSVDEAVKLASRLLEIEPQHRIARLVVGVKALKQKQYKTARIHLAESVRGPIADLTATLLTGWSWVGSARAANGIKAIDKLAGPDWYGLFKEYHTGMILDATGSAKAAGPRIDKAYKLDSTALRLVQAQGRWLSRNGEKDEALAVYAAFEKVLPRHPLIEQDMAALKRGDKLPLIATTPQQGAAEALYGLGSAIGRQGGEELGIVYLQLAIWLNPDLSLALISLADLSEQMKKPERALTLYERVPAHDPLRRNAEIQSGVNLNVLDRPDDAIKHLAALVAASPGDIEAIVALGNVQRVRKMWSDCAQTYSKGIDQSDASAKRNWYLFYFRGICLERNKEWSKAEADLKKALELSPEQPHVLNYLGYTWVDQGINLDPAMEMIRRAVQLRPEDGYIVDSLGWAYYRLGKHDEAVKYLERAVELRADDPVINDHLGDAYWRVGRQLEATFQWRHAKDNKPEPEDLERIEKKLKEGLKDDAPNAAETERKRNGG